MERVWIKDGKIEEYSLVFYPAQCDPLVEVLCWPLRISLGLLLLGTYTLNKAEKKVLKV